MDEQNLLKSTNLSDYSFEELSSMLDIFQCIHNKYPLGVCIKKIYTIFFISCMAPVAIQKNNGNLLLLSTVIN